VFQASGPDVEKAPGPNVTICVLAPEAGCLQPNGAGNDLRQRQLAHKIWIGRPAFGTWAFGLK